ncbi:condensation domain-containing protein [Nonomuraea sp. NPDC050643]|uniref:condensation domain-containing protein n=1 Tax=Nonomuraea sp. NPDC050643 TaxID=3155660 RepID=UPI003411D47F
MSGPITPSWSQRARLLQQVEDERAGVYRAFHSVSALRVRGGLDLAALDRAWHHLQRRHPVLLTSFDREKPLWHLDPAEPADLELHTAPRDADDARQVLVRQAERPFDAERGPLARLVAISRPETTEILLGLIADHLVCDAWSRRLLVRDLRLLYDREIGAGVEEPAPAQGGFAAFVERQNDYLESGPGLRMRRKVAGQIVPPGPDTAVVGRTVPVTRELDADSYGRLLGVARNVRLTRTQVVLAALDAALADLGGHFPKAATMVVAGRPRADLHGAVGWFSSQVAVVTPARHADPRDHLRSFHAGMVAALDAARVPWPLAVGDAVPHLFSRPLSLPYLAFNAQPLRMRTALRPLPFAGTEVSELPVNLGRQEGSLLSYWTERDDGGLSATLRYKPERYGAADVAALWESTTSHLDWFVRRMAP